MKSEVLLFHSLLREGKQAGLQTSATKHHMKRELREQGFVQFAVCQVTRTLHVRSAGISLGLPGSSQGVQTVAYRGTVRPTARIPGFCSCSEVLIYFLPTNSYILVRPQSSSKPYVPSHCASELELQKNTIIVDF